MVLAVLLPQRATASIIHMYEPRSKERIGSALRALAADLVTERRRVVLLRRENRELRAKLAALQGVAPEAGQEESDEERETPIAELLGQALPPERRSDASGR